MSNSNLALLTTLGKGYLRLTRFSRFRYRLNISANACNSLKVVTFFFNKGDDGTKLFYVLEALWYLQGHSSDFWWLRHDRIWSSNRKRDMNVEGKDIKESERQRKIKKSVWFSV